MIAGSLWTALILAFGDLISSLLSGVYFSEKFPPGSSLIINQTIFKGSNNISGEIKYLPTFRNAEFLLSQKEAIDLVNKKTLGIS